MIRRIGRETLRVIHQEPSTPIAKPATVEASVNSWLEAWLARSSSPRVVCGVGGHERLHQGFAGRIGQTGVQLLCFLEICQNRLERFVYSRQSHPHALHFFLVAREQEMLRAGDAVVKRLKRFGCFERKDLVAGLAGLDLQLAQASDDLDLARVEHGRSDFITHSTQLHDLVKRAAVILRQRFRFLHLHEIALGKITARFIDGLGHLLRAFVEMGHVRFGARDQKIAHRETEFDHLRAQARGQFRLGRTIGKSSEPLSGAIQREQGARRDREENRQQENVAGRDFSTDGVGAFAHG